MRAIRSRRALAGSLDDERPAAPSAVRNMLAGYTVGLANPKAAVFFAAVLPQFVDRSAGHVSSQLLLLGVVWLLLALACDSCTGLAAGTLRAWFGRSPRRLEYLGGTGGLAMIGLGVSVALTGRKD